MLLFLFHFIFNNIQCMSMSSSLFRQKDSSFSADIEDLKQQNRILFDENLTLKKSLEELININT